MSELERTRISDQLSTDLTDRATQNMAGLICDSTVKSGLRFSQSAEGVYGVSKIVPHMIDGVEAERLKPEIIRESIGIEVQRLFSNRFSSDTNWDTHRTVVGFQMLGKELPEWLTDQVLAVSTDGSLVKMRTDPRRGRMANQREVRNKPVFVGYVSYGHLLSPKGGPIMFDTVSGNETAEAHYDRLNEKHGFGFEDVSDKMLPSLLITMAKIDYA